MDKKDDSLLDNLKISGELKNSSKVAEEKPVFRKYRTKHMKQFPELYRSDVSIHPSYTGLKIYPYHVVCRQRVQRIQRQSFRQLNREIAHFAMAQTLALDGVRIDRVFSIGMSPKMLIVPDLLTEKERRRLNELIED
ncbi:hypothetical protein ALC56_07486 [Trachymyrmex septentrionalis]|uniref:Uncharacterized protein n=1 Tax=Trachymyrmex septentrionalis TaxID=34720 RepID=A0A151JWJ5_9HYME|nr:PREDICTED: uncharacterized protein LOC108749543 [Trachymyrmex septentrionalis]XP_018343806.1 PREDICTED: uncharacterized protein LOC108749543 [Trachymyrmex septentrionalis]XP_018343807.1 PREDICTED: uncharacterized protein LOC108749543 [Trachymyrmex septentrionalis]KYN38156.1 hypothetical protein ALC56_07486 [Trachymyrmex septentrionalis]